MRGDWEKEDERGLGERECEGIGRKRFGKKMNRQVWDQLECEGL